MDNETACDHWMGPLHFTAENCPLCKKVIYEAALDWMWEQLPVDQPIGPADEDAESTAIAAVIEAARKRSPLYDSANDAVDEQQP